MASTSSCLASPATAAAAPRLRVRVTPRAGRVVACSAGGGCGPEAAGLFAGERKAVGGLACGVLAAWAVASSSSPVIAASQVGLHGILLGGVVIFLWWNKSRTIVTTGEQIHRLELRLAGIVCLEREIT